MPELTETEQEWLAEYKRICIHDYNLDIFPTDDDLLDHLRTGNLTPADAAYEDVTSF